MLKSDEDPCLEVGTVDKLVLIVKSLEGRVLAEILGIIAIERKRVGKVEEIWLESEQFPLELGGIHSKRRSVVSVLK